MEKTEKIISEFERFIQKYDRDIGFTSYDSEVLKGVLELLKAQEPVRPVLFVMDETKTNGVDSICSNCKGDFFHHHVSFCPWCGRAVKWN